MASLLGIGAVGEKRSPGALPQPSGRAASRAAGPRRCGPRRKRCRREGTGLVLCGAPVLVGRGLALRTKVGEMHQRQGAATRRAVRAAESVGF